MTTSILGLSAFYHDSAAALVVDGQVVAAAQEERFTRIKHDAAFPAKAVQFCLEKAGLTPDQISYVAFYEKPLIKFGRLMETYFAFAPEGFSSFRKAMPLWISKKLFLPREIRRELGGYAGPLVFPEHHESHAASAFFPSPYQDAALLTLDGVGEWATASLGHGRDNRITLTHELRFPHSVGLLYSAFTYYTGFKVNSGEYKLMGLAPYGVPRFAGLIRDNLMDLKEDGSLRLDLSYFNFCQGLTMTSEKFHQLFGRPARRAEDRIEAFHMDLAASIQAVTEEIMLRMTRHLHILTSARHLVMAGGVALNCVGNGRLLREGPFEDIWIQPASGDAGGALGAALFTWHQLLDHPRTAPGKGDLQSGSFLGPVFDDKTVQSALDVAGAHYERIDDEEAYSSRIADLLAGGQIVAWFQGRMEFGPRALGARSIVGDPRDPEMQTKMNVKIKFRESFRPFAPSVLHDHVHEYFQMKPGQDSSYMLMVAPVAEAQRIETPAGTESLEGIEKLKVPRSRIPATTHVDHSARIHTVDPIRNPRYHQLLTAFHRKTGCAVLVNTSYNVRGEPIVGTPADAYRCFMLTDIDALAIGPFVCLKEQQPKVSAQDRERYVASFTPD